MRTGERQERLRARYRARQAELSGQRFLQQYWEAEAERHGAEVHECDLCGARSVNECRRCSPASA